MEQSKKIYVSKTDSLASIVGKIVKAKEENIVLYIPRGTAFASSRTNFILLKREVTAAGKNMAIESVDEDALELADIAGIKAVNPFMRRRQKAVSDIVVVTSSRSFSPRADKEEKEPVEEVDEKEELGKPDEEPAPVQLSGEEKKESTPRRFLIAAASTALVAAIIVLTLTALPRAKIQLTLEKKNLDFVGSVVASDVIKESSFSREEVKVRGVSFVEKKNITKAYPASGKKYVEQKASGKLIIYNNFSSAPQTLVATTRFVAPDGKLYRLNNTLTIPGAQVGGSKITPSSIEAAVTADKPGADYNLSSGVKFRIPGFQGSPKYDGFYAQNNTPISGGFVGQSSLPSEEDMKSAKADVEKTLEETAKTQLLFNLPPEIKVLNNAYSFKITETKVNEAAEEKDKFTITAYGEARLVGFREPELVETIGKGLIAKNGNEFKVENYELEYGEPGLRADGSLTIPIKFKSLWTRTFDGDHFKSEAAGKKRTELQALVFSVKGIQSGEVRLWPFWVNRVPKDPSRIIVDVK